MPIDDDELYRRLGYHPAGPATAPRFELNRSLALLVGAVWARALPEGREQSLALTSLQDALMWANAAVACNVAPDGPPPAHVDVSVQLDDVLDRLEGPTLTRSGSVRPSTGPERPETGPDGPEGAYQVRYRGVDGADDAEPPHVDRAVLEAELGPELHR